MALACVGDAMLSAAGREYAILGDGLFRKGFSLILLIRVSRCQRRRLLILPAGAALSP